MYKWGNECYYIDPREVVAISFVDGTEKFPFGMAVYLRGGTKLQVNYDNKKSRAAAAEQISRENESATTPPVTRYEAAEIVKKAKESIRREIKALREELREANDGPTI